MSVTNDIFTPEQHEEYLREFDRRCNELSELARKCVTQVSMIGRATLMLICLLIDRDSETPPTCSSIHIARAFLHTQGFRVATVTDFYTVSHRGGVIASWFEGDEYRYITLCDLITQFYGETFMHDEHVRLFGPIDDDVMEDVPFEPDADEPWEHDEPEGEFEPTPVQEPSPDPGDDDIGL
jgi:hypothetical protein